MRLMFVRSLSLIALSYNTALSFDKLGYIWFAKEVGAFVGIEMQTGSDFEKTPRNRYGRQRELGGFIFPVLSGCGGGGSGGFSAENSDDEPPLGSPGSKTILVVEDDDDVRAIVEELLTDSGYRILSARNGQEALIHLHSSEVIDLLFTDVVMPGGMNGPDVAAAAGTIRPTLQVLFTSGYLGHALAGGGRAALGPRPFLPKPYRPAKLIDTIKDLLGA